MGLRKVRLTVVNPIQLMGLSKVRHTVVPKSHAQLDGTFMVVVNPMQNLIGF